MSYEVRLEGVWHKVGTSVKLGSGWLDYSISQSCHTMPGVVGIAPPTQWREITEVRESCERPELITRDGRYFHLGDRVVANHYLMASSPEPGVIVGFLDWDTFRIKFDHMPDVISIPSAWLEKEVTH